MRLTADTEAVTTLLDERAQELASLARLVTYARQTALDVKADFSAYCLDLALGAILQDLSDCGLLPVENHERQVNLVPIDQ